MVVALVISDKDFPIMMNGYIIWIDGTVVVEILYKGTTVNKAVISTMWPSCVNDSGHPEVFAIIISYFKNT